MPNHKAFNRRWAALWQIDNKLDGYQCHFLRDDNHEWAVFRTRGEARKWIKKNFGYILTRPDLRAEPHGWKYPKVVRVSISIEVDNV